MSIAVTTSPENAIANLSDLVAEIRDELDDSGYALDKIYRAITRSESRFNRELRVPEMETETILDVSEEVTGLPGDFLEMRSVYQEGEPDSPLRNTSAGEVRRVFNGREGVPCVYAIENRRLIIGPVGETQLQMTYFQRIPALTADNPSNWLLDRHPDLYLHQALAIIFNRIGDSERGALNLGIADDIIAQVQREGVNARWGDGSIAPARLSNIVSSYA